MSHVCSYKHVYAWTYICITERIEETSNKLIGKDNIQESSNYFNIRNRFQPDLELCTICLPIHATVTSKLLRSHHLLHAVVNPD